MKTSRWSVTVVLVAVSVAFVGIVPTVDAGVSAKAKCRIGTPARVQIAVSANGLAPGTAEFVVINDRTKAVSSVLSDPVDVLGDAAAEWDSAINALDVAEGVRGPIGADFAVVGDKILAAVLQGGKVVSGTSTGCGAK